MLGAFKIASSALCCRGESASIVSISAIDNHTLLLYYPTSKRAWDHSNVGQWGNYGKRRWDNGAGLWCLAGARFSLVPSCVANPTGRVRA